MLHTEWYILWFLFCTFSTLYTIYIPSKKNCSVGQTSVPTYYKVLKRYVHIIDVQFVILIQFWPIKLFYNDKVCVNILNWTFEPKVSVTVPFSNK